MISMNEIIAERVSLHMREKILFNDCNFNSLRLVAVSPAKYVYESDSEISKNELRALNRLFNVVFDDLTSSDSDHELWKTVYAYPDDNERYNFLNTAINIFDCKSESLIPINANPNTSELFIKSLISLATVVYNSQKDDSFVSKDISRISKIFLTGEVGNGKTTFLKYLYSICKDKIEEKAHCFWLHIDFSNQLFRNKTIQDAIKFASAQHYRDKFLEKMTYQEVEEFKNFLREYFYYIGANKDQVEVELEASINEYLSIYDSQRIKIFDWRLQNGLINYIEKKYPTIYIIDGIDNIDSKEHYQEKINDIYEILSDSNRKGTFIFVMRNESHRNFISNYINTSSIREEGRIFDNYKIFAIEPAKLYSVVSKRFDFLLLRGQKIIRDNSPLILPSIEGESKDEFEKRIETLIEKMNRYYDKDILMSYFHLFMIYLHKGIKFGFGEGEEIYDVTEAISELKDLIGTNFRKLLNSINLIHETFLDIIERLGPDPLSDVINIMNLYKNKKLLDGISDSRSKYELIMSKEYRVIPKLLRWGVSYEHPYYYQYDEIEKGLVKVGRKSDHSKYIYNIFYPVNADGRDDEQYTLLLKIRILQYLLLNKENQNYNTRMEQYIIMYLSTYFPYSRERIHLAITELIEIHLVTYEWSNKDYYLSINRVGENHIMKLIFNFSYLRIIIDDILVPQFYADKFIDKYPELFSKSKDKWIIRQIPRVATFLLLVSKVENCEKKDLIVKNDYEWDITNKMRDSIIKTISKICSQHDRETKDLISAFTAHFKRP